MNKKTGNIQASIRQRLLNLSRERREDFNLTLTRYGLERFLYRLSISKARDRFVLKGAMLFAVWADVPYRPTRDLDLLGYGDDSTERIKELFQELCRIHVESDGIEFSPQSVQVEDIRPEEEYQGKRIRLTGRLGTATIRLQVDVGFGDAVTPEAKRIAYPVLLGHPEPMILAYPKETVVSEKLQAMVAFGIVNSRMKDFYDIWELSRRFSFDGETLAQAIRATFERRRTPIPKDAPTALTESFAADIDKSRQWKAFLEKIGAGGEIPPLEEIIESLRAFLLPPMQAVGQGSAFPCRWENGGPWMDFL